MRTSEAIGNTPSTSARGVSPAAWAEFGHQNSPKPALKSTVASLTMWFARLVNESTASEAAPH
jgi:hypothetical protein